MRSARTVSNVIRIMLGGSVAAAASAGNRTKRQRIQARRIREKGVCIVADSLFGTKALSRRSENELRPELHSPRATGRKERIARGDVWRLRVRREAGVREVVYLFLRNRDPSRYRIKIRMVQQVESLKADLQAHPLCNLGGFVEVSIPLDEMGTAKGVAATGTNGSIGRNGKDRGHIRDGGAVGVAELIDGFADAVWPLIGEVLPGVIRAAREQRCPRPPGGESGDAPNLPAVSQSACCTPFREVIPDARVEVSTDVRIARALVAPGIIRILLDRKRR